MKYKLMGRPVFACSLPGAEISTWEQGAR